jgi:hypothetical protein
MGFFSGKSDTAGRLEAMSKDAFKAGLAAQKRGDHKEARQHLRESIAAGKLAKHAGKGR